LKKYKKEQINIGYWFGWESWR